MFTLSGFTGDKPALLAGGNLISYMASLALAIWLSDRFGRRKLMLWGSSLMGIVLIIGAILSREVLVNTSANPEKTSRLGAGVAAVLFVYTALYGSTWLTTCWYVNIDINSVSSLLTYYRVYPTEVFPLATRAKGTALATVAFSIAGGTINEIIPYLINAVGFWTFVIFALTNFAILVPIYLFYIGKSSLSSLGLIYEEGVADNLFRNGKQRS